MNNDALNQQIFKTLAYFDIFDFPLTKEELFRYLWHGFGINYSEFDARRPQRFGFYFLPGRERIVESRRRATVPTEQKLRVADKAAKLIRSVPFARAIFVCNSVAMETASLDSDIDLFIVTAPKRIWIVRLFTNLILKIFRLRVGAAHSASKICLSFFADSNNLNLDNIRVAEDDIYLAYWIYQLLPLYDPEGCQFKIIEQNKWVANLLPNIMIGLTLGQDFGGAGRSHPGKAERIWKKMWERMWGRAYGDMVENQARELQMFKLKIDLKEKVKSNDKGVILNNGMIKLHENDRRIEIREKWLAKISNLSAQEASGKSQISNQTQI